jgi:hypothetical protein
MKSTDLETRLRILEQRVARQRLLLIIVVCAFLTVGVGAFRGQVSAASAGIPDVVKAKAFHVISEDGAMVVELSAVGDTGCVATYDSNGLTQTALGSDDEGGGYITCFNKKGEIHVNLGGDKDGGQIVTNGKTGVPRVLLSGDKKGGFISTFDTEGKPKKIR